MDIGMQVNPVRRAAYHAAQTVAAKVERQGAPRAGRTRDNVEISPEARAALAKESASVSSVAKGAGAPPAVDFASFSDVYTGLVRDYDRTVRDHYGAAHRENLTFDDPAHHVWEKYKDQGSDCFRSDLSELERAWAFDQEMDLVQRGGKNMNLTDPLCLPRQRALVLLDGCAGQPDRARPDGSGNRAAVS